MEWSGTRAFCSCVVAYLAKMHTDAQMSFYGLVIFCSFPDKESVS